MSPDLVMTIAKEAITTTVLLAAPLLLSALAVGLVVGVFQAATQINEQTLSFVPKLLVLAMALVVAGPWLLGLLIDFTRRLFSNIPALLG